MTDSLFPNPPDDGPYTRQHARARAVAGCDVTRNKHKDNPQSEAAHAAILDNKSHECEVILAFIRGEGEYGATAQEVAHGTWLPYQSTSARCSELLRDGKVRRNGVTRKTSAGKSAAVLVAVEPVVAGTP